MKKNLTLSEEEKKSSDKLKQIIHSEIKLEGPISFSRFMQLALYHPEFGYYQAKSNIFSQDGDYTTSPNISSMFAEVFVNDFEKIFELSGKNILELGAGNGNFCASILKCFDSRKIDFEHYYIFESSASLIHVAKTQLKKKLSPKDYSKIIWLEELPSSFRGVIFMNEFFDALPVGVYLKKDKKVFEKYVDIKNDHFVWVEKSIEENYQFNNLPIDKLPNDYTFEYSEGYELWVKQIRKTLAQGAIFIIDYGFHEQELFHPDRSSGTMMCYSKHQSHFDPFLNIGQQDISCHVNFSLLKRLMDKNFQIEGFVSQANYLINANILELLNAFDPEDDVLYRKKVSELNILISPAEMGDIIKVLAFSKDINLQLEGFSKNDRSHTL